MCRSHWNLLESLIFVFYYLDSCLGMCLFFCHFKIVYCFVSSHLSSFTYNTTVLSFRKTQWSKIELNFEHIPFIKRRINFSIHVNIIQLIIHAYNNVCVYIVFDFIKFGIIHAFYLKNRAFNLKLVFILLFMLCNVLFLMYIRWRFPFFLSMCLF